MRGQGTPICCLLFEDASLHVLASVEKEHPSSSTGFPKKRRQVGSNSRLHRLRINPGQQPDPDPEAGIWNDIDRTPPSMITR